MRIHSAFHPFIIWAFLPYTSAKLRLDMKSKMPLEFGGYWDTLQDAIEVYKKTCGEIGPKIASIYRNSVPILLLDDS